MPVNPYFNHLYNTKEQDFFEQLVVENIKVAGMDVHYIPREHGMDPILRESTMTNFVNKVVVEAYFHDVDGYGGDGTLMSKFGFTQMNTVKLSIAKKRWRDLAIPNRLERPREGDVVFVPFSKSLFEVEYVEHEDPFWQIGRYHVFKLSCTLFTRTYDEKFITDDPFLNGAGNPDNATEINNAINNSIKTKMTTLGSFDEKNPFSDI